MIIQPVFSFQKAFTPSNLFALTAFRRPLKQRFNWELRDFLVLLGALFSSPGWSQLYTAALQEGLSCNGACSSCTQSIAAIQCSSPDYHSAIAITLGPYPWNGTEYCEMKGPCFSCPDGYVFANQQLSSRGPPVCIAIDDIDKSGDNRCGIGNPIDITIGEKYQKEIDYEESARFGLKFSRLFQSHSLDENPGLGNKWRHNYNRNIRPAGDTVVVYRQTGAVYKYSKVGSDWITDADTPDRLVEVLDSNGIRTGWIYTTLDQDVETYNSANQLISITNRQGQQITLDYEVPVASGGDDNNLTLDKVIGFNGAALTFTYNSAFRLSSVAIPDSGNIAFGYDLAGNLVSVTYPNNGGTRTYHYEDSNLPHALTGITDANGDRFATWTYDSSGRAISSTHHNSPNAVNTHTIDYTYIDDGTDPRATVTNPLGKQTTYHFTTLHGVRKVTQVEGHQSANCAAADKDYTYDVNGFLASKTDWQGNTTTYVRNAKGQELSRTEALGTPNERTVTTEWHSTFNLPIRITELGRETTITYDANGNELSRTVTEIP